MSNLRLALDLAAQGFFILPCQNAPGTEDHKKPQPGVLWRSRCTTERAKIEAWWRLWPDALPGINCGKSGLVVVDLDRHPGGADGVAAWARLANGHDVTCPTSDTPSGGRHLIFRQPEGQPLGNSEGDLPDGMNVRGDGGYIIAPGARCLDGKAYVLTGVLADAPVIDEWLVAIIRPAREAKPPAPRLVVSNDTPDVNPAYVNAALNAELDKVRGASKGNRNNQLNDSACAVGNMVAAGWLSESEASSCLLDAALAAGLKRNESIKTIRSGLERGMQEPREAPVSKDAELEAMGARLAADLVKAKQAEPRIIQVEQGDLIDGDTGEIIAEAKPARQRKTERLPEHLTMVPGLVGEIVDWIEATARRPSRIMALAAALAVVGTVIGRDRAGPTNSATHLFLVVFAVTGGGKAHPLGQAGRLLDAAGLNDHLGPGDFKSGAGVTNTIARMPLSLCRMDEFGAFIRRINDIRSGAFVRDVTSVLRKAWDSNFAPMSTDEGARQQAQTINAPAMSILGASTEREFYDGLSGDDVLSGFLNRFGMLVETERAHERDPAVDPFVVPDQIASKLAYLYDGGNKLANAKRMAQAIIKPRKVPWANDAARSVYVAMSAEIEAIAEADESRGPYFARAAEMAVRAATIVACGVDPSAPVVTAEIMTWARDVFMYSARTMEAGVSVHLAETPEQKRAKEVVRLIQEAGGVIGHSDLYRRLKYRHKARDLKETLTSLAEGGTIAVLDGQKPPRGPAPRFYRFLRPI